MLLNGNGARRPGYQIRGARLTEEQAFDVLAHSDEVFTTYVNDVTFAHSVNNVPIPDCVPIIMGAISKNRIIRTPYRNIGNKFLQTANFPWYNGFVTPRGDVGCNWWAYTYPEYYEMLLDTWTFAARFPFLEFVVAVTFWNERSVSYWSNFSKKQTFRNYDKELKKDLQCCLYAHNGVIEVLNNLDKYYELEAVYPDKRVFEITDYYDLMQENVLSKDFVDRMLSCNGLDTLEEFKAYVYNCYAAQYKYNKGEK